MARGAPSLRRSWAERAGDRDGPPRGRRGSASRPDRHEACRKRPVPRGSRAARSVCASCVGLAKELVTDVRLALALGGVLELVARARPASCRRPAQQLVAPLPAGREPGAGWLRLPDLPTLGPDSPLGFPERASALADARAATLQQSSWRTARIGLRRPDARRALHWRFPIVFGGRVSAVRRLIRADGAPVPIRRAERSNKHRQATDGALAPPRPGRRGWASWPTVRPSQGRRASAATRPRKSSRLAWSGNNNGAAAGRSGHPGCPAAELAMTLDALTIRETRSVRAPGSAPHPPGPRRERGRRPRAAHPDPRTATSRSR